MKTSHIIYLVLIAGAIGALLMYSVDFSTYDTIDSAQKKPGRSVHLIAKVDKNYPIEYNALKNPNLLTFHAIDSLGATTAVIYHNPKPSELEKSERVVLKGKMNSDHVFECKEILLKCPSKYKDDKAQLQKMVSTSNTQ